MTEKTPKINMEINKVMRKEMTFITEMKNTIRMVI